MEIQLLRGKRGLIHYSHNRYAYSFLTQVSFFTPDGRYVVTIGSPHGSQPDRNPENSAIYEGVFNTILSSFHFGTRHSDINFCHLSGPESLEIVQDLTRERLQNLEREEIVRIFTDYYIAQDRRGVQAILGTLSSESDVIDALAALGSILPSKPILDIYDRVAALAALQWRQNHEMPTRIERVNGRLRLGGYEFLTEQEEEKIREGWPSISQLGNQLLADTCPTSVIGEIQE